METNNNSICKLYLLNDVSSEIRDVDVLQRLRHLTDEKDNYYRDQHHLMAYTCENHIPDKAVIDRRHRPRCCHQGSYFKRPKSSPVRPLACNWYYCAEFIAKPKAACALRLSWAATSSNLGLRTSMTSSIKPEVHNASLRRQRRTEPRPYVTRTNNLAKIGRAVTKI